MKKEERIFRNVSEGQGAPEAKINKPAARKIRESRFYREEGLSLFSGLVSKESKITIHFDNLGEIARQKGIELVVEDIDTSNYSALYYVNMSLVASASVRSRIEMFELQNCLQWGGLIVFDKSDWNQLKQMYEFSSEDTELVDKELTRGQIVLLDSSCMKNRN